MQQTTFENLCHDLHVTMRVRAKTFSGFGPLTSQIVTGALPKPALTHITPEPSAKSDRVRDLVESELEALLPKTFLEIPFERLHHLPRYLKALLTRAERAALNPLKDQERARQLVPYLEALRKIQTVELKSDLFRQQLEEFRWMLEEFKVSLFAQELGTLSPISPKRLDQHLTLLRSQ